MWEGIKEACKKKCLTFDFGRTSIANKGLCQYKSRWGAIEAPLHYARMPHVSKSEALDETTRKHAFAKWIITRMPQLAVRITGELLYKHFA